ncbi:MAG: DUF1592 domain-containing protein [Myxococcota bacterium]
MRVQVGISSALALLLACQGTFSDDPYAAGEPLDPVQDPDLAPASCSPELEPAVRGVPTRILTGRELNNALRELFPNVELPNQEIQFDGRVESCVVYSRDDVLEAHIREYRGIAETLAPLLVEDLNAVMDCAGASDADCATRYIEDFASRAFRRPVSADEQAGLVALYRTGAEVSHAEGMRYVFEAVLQTPSFIYVHETPADTLAPHEVAQRMAAMFARSVPDSELLAAAEDGSLMNANARVEHAERLLATPAGQAAIGAFVGEWFGIDRLRDTPLALEDQALAAGMEEETRRFVDRLVSQGSARFTDLLAANYTYLNEAMAAHYGYSLDGAEAIGDGWYRVELEGSAGLLTHGSFLSQHHGPVHRGLAIRRGLLCGDVPGPDDIDITAVPTGETEAERSKTEKRLDHPTCGGCHRMMDPMGLALDTFDDHGVPRTEDQHGNPVRDDGEILSSDVDGVIQGAAELGNRLSQSEDVRACVARNLFAWSYARAATAADSCVIERIQNHLATNDDDFRAALVGIVASDQFVRSLQPRVGGEQ